MKDNGQKRITVSVRLTPEEHQALRAEAARRAQQSGEPFDKSRIVREALEQWFNAGSGHHE